MIGIRNNILASALILVALFGFVHLTFASEVTGTLSSDGSAANEQGTVLNDSSRPGTEVTNQVGANNTLQGTVIEGREDGVGFDQSSWILAWGAAIVAALLVGIAYTYRHAR